mgnify:CR=1 FL=1
MLQILLIVLVVSLILVVVYTTMPTIIAPSITSVDSTVKETTSPTIKPTIKPIDNSNVTYKYIEDTVSVHDKLDWIDPNGTIPIHDLNAYTMPVNIAKAQSSSLPLYIADKTTTHPSVSVNETTPQSITLPPGVVNGMNVTCKENVSIFLIENNKKRLHINVNSFKLSKKPLFTIDCETIDKIPRGVDLPSLPEGIYNGLNARCATTDSVYLIEDFKKRLYPNPDIYNYFGNPDWTDINCNTINTIPSGLNMSM